MAHWLGMAGPGNFDAVSGMRPESYRQGILRLFPNGSMPVTGITSMMKSESVDDYHFHWWNKGLPKSTYDVTGVYTFWADIPVKLDCPDLLMIILF